MSEDRIRWSMSLRKRDDRLIEYFSTVEDGDRSAECRKLMYLGLELLELRANGMEPTAQTEPTEMVRPLRTPRKQTP